LILLVLSFNVVSAQEILSKEEQERRAKNVLAGNPFAKYGSKAHVATLSNGKYLEVHDLDSIVTIGRVRWHVKNQQIVGRIIHDPTDPYAQPIGDAVGRWISPDPLGEKMPNYGSYVYAFNNPIRFIDPDGRAPLPYDIITNVSNKKGDIHYVQRDVSIRMTLTIVNSNSADLSKTMFNKSIGTVQLLSMTGVAQKDFRGNDIYASDNLQNVFLDYKVVNSLKEVGENDHVMMLVNDIPKIANGIKPVGLAIKGGRVSAVEIGTIKNSTFNQAAQHEIGHNLGLEHKNGGLMNPSIIAGTTSTSASERGNILYNQVGPLEGNGIYIQSQNSTNYNNKIQTQVNDFLAKNKIK
ncbi:hypothetical protein ACFFUQ_12695, partial [Flavobacterium branchiarum]